MFKIIVFFIITLFAMLYMRIVILHTSANYVHDRIFSLSWEVWVHYTSLTTPLCIKTAVLIQESDRSCRSNLKKFPLSTILLIQYWMLELIFVFLLIDLSYE